LEKYQEGGTTIPGGRPGEDIFLELGENFPGGLCRRNFSGTHAGGCFTIIKRDGGGDIFTEEIFGGELSPRRKIREKKRGDVI